MTDDLFDEPEISIDPPGPIVIAQFDGDDACCGEGIHIGEEIRADGSGCWIHKECGDL